MLSPNFNSKFLTKYLLPVGDFLFRQRNMDLYEFYKEAQWWSREKLVDYQNKKLRETVSISYKEVRFYKDLYDAHGVKVEKIKGVEDLRLLPIINKSDLKKSYPYNCTRKTDWPSSLYFTSGSSGQPFEVRVDNLTMSHARALMFLRASFSGWDVGIPSLQTGMSLKRGLVKLLKDICLRVYYVSAFDLSDKMLDKYLSIIEKKKLKFVMGYPGSIYYLAKRAEVLGFNWKLDGVVSWGDNLYSHFRQKIERVFKCKVTDTYGCGEGIQVAAQCGSGDGGYHIFMPHVIVEVVDDNGSPVNRGDLGHIILTRLDPGVMPFIRYRVGDMGILSELKTCPCGRGLDMLSSIQGRDTDAVITPNGNRLIVHFFTGIFEYYPSIENFFIFQDKAGSISVEIVPCSDFEISHWERIKNEILKKGDPDLKMEMKIVNQTSNAFSGKRRFVLSEYRSS